MEDQRFDALARGLATSSTRRQALKALGGGAVGALLAAIGVRNVAAKDKDTKKPDCCPQEAPTLCTRTCVDTSSDPVNCGACGSVCPQGGTCVDGACVAAPCAVAEDCLPPDDPCEVAVCVAGACAAGPRCPADATCDDGDCICPAGNTYCASGHVCVPNCPPSAPLNPNTCTCDEHFCTSGSAGCANIPCGLFEGEFRCYCQQTLEGENACIVFPTDCDELRGCHGDFDCDPGSVCILSDCCGPAEPLCMQICT